MFGGEYYAQPIYGQGFSGPITAHNYNQALTASLTPTATLAKNTQRLQTAQASFVGTLLKQDNRILTAQLSFIGGTLLMLIKLPFGSNLSFIGNLQRSRIGRILTAQLSFSGALNRVNRWVRSSQLSFIGTPFLLLIKIPMAAQVSFSGSLRTNQSVKFLAAALSFSGALNRTVGKIMTASLSFLGSLTNFAFALIRPIGIIINTFSATKDMNEANANASMYGQSLVKNINDSVNQSNVSGSNSSGIINSDNNQKTLGS